MLTYNIELIPNSAEGFSKVNEILEKSRMIWNIVSKNQYEIGSKFNRKILHDVSYHSIRKLNPEIPSQIIIKVQNDVISTYKSIKSNEQKIEEPAVKNNLSLRLDKRLCRIRGNSIYITTLDKREQFNFKLYDKVIKMFELYNFGDPLIFIRNNRLFISIPFYTDKFISDKPTDTAFGVDMGMNNIAVTSEGLIYSGKQFLASKRKDRHLRKKLYQNGSKSARKHARKNKGKESRRGKNFCHEISNSILKDGQGSVLVLEDLKNIKKNTLKKSNIEEIRNFNGKWANMPIMTIQSILGYKAAFYNKKVCFVSPTNTSKIDSRTGKKSGTRNKGRYIGKDKKILHSDINASINIANRSNLPLSGNPLTRNHALFGQAVVNRPIVYKSLRASALSAVQAPVL